jgi:hypothetical protein
MWLRWLLLLGTFGMAIGLSLGLVLFAEPLGLAAGNRPQSLFFDRLGPLASPPLEWAAVLWVLGVLALLAIGGRTGRKGSPARTSDRPARRSKAQ